MQAPSPLHPLNSFWHSQSPSQACLAMGQKAQASTAPYGESEVFGLVNPRVGFIYHFWSTCGCLGQCLATSMQWGAVLCGWIPIWWCVIACSQKVQNSQHDIQGFSNRAFGQKYNAAWVTWFSKLPRHITLVTYVTKYRGWNTPLQAAVVFIWLKDAPVTLKRVEFWLHVDHVQFTEDHHLGRVWAGKADVKPRVRYAFGRNETDTWSMLAEGPMMSGPDAELIHCLCWWMAVIMIQPIGCPPREWFGEGIQVENCTWEDSFQQAPCC